MDEIADKVSQVKQTLQELIDETRKSEGCIKYELFQNINDKHQLTFIEQWESEETLDKHTQSEYLKAAQDKIKDALTKPPDVKRYKHT
ncbi:unnamed protein product [Didymodactylos carnosus]|uniref:ABM domain-containing protein n=1 Tax=Didymodactylos carnosus TaxID=1234261 RepID=A0A813W8G0_9BILA|nr:unnamed protein product [Didymodactylos carnosus]CAF3641486.1 unnamed protein product [Didymodactylos carnosus]